MPIPCVLMRGGTSKAVFLRDADLPRDPAERLRTVLAIFGSPDRRQIDGLGGADPLTSKVAIIGNVPPDEPRAAGSHLSYTFGQVEIDLPAIDDASPCGNIVSAVGVYAIHAGLVKASGSMTRVKVFNTNLQRIISLEVPTANGAPLEHGDFEIPGVPGTGAEIVVDFSDAAGAACGALLPTGNVVDVLDLGDDGQIEVSLLDIGNPHVFVRARDVGLTGVETKQDIDANPALLLRLEKIRGIAAAKFGLVEDPARAAQDSRVTPMLAMVAAPANYQALGRSTDVQAHEVDIVSRLIFLGSTHSNYAATSIVCTGVAAKLQGSIVNQVASTDFLTRHEFRIGHPAGVSTTQASVDWSGGEPVVKRATLSRTARRLLEGRVFIRD